MNRTRLRPFLVLTALVASLLPAVGPVVAASSHGHSVPGSPTRLVSGLDGARAAPSAPMARCTSPKRSRQDLARRSADRGHHDVRERSAEDVPTIGIGGAMDVAFIGKTAYVLVTLVGPDVGGSDVVGIYRVDGPDSFTVVADIGAFSVANPPATRVLSSRPGPVRAANPIRGGFLVTDGHHNRVLRVTLDGEVTRVDRVRQHRPDRAGGAGQHDLHGRGRPRPPPARRTARSCRSGRSRPPPRTWPPAAPLLVDVEFGRGQHALRPLAGHLAVSATLRVLRRCRTPARS